MSDHSRPGGRKALQWGCIGLGLLLITSILLWPILARAASPARLCEAAAQRAAQRHDVPFDLLRAIVLAETGLRRAGQITPWPWAVHAEGRGHWSATRAEALALVRMAQARGVRNIDLGCFQINLHWHSAHFASLDDMIDPDRNADFAARLLKQHKARLGSWEAATGAYHSATPDLAARYRARVAQYRTKSESEPRLAALQPNSPALMGALRPTTLSGARMRLIDLDPGQ
ncbi:MAG: lytic transglycosylase domain-containing protein [Rhodobacteraceae bacterium]|nr:MAG: lytic transglycosylase domain-containing protein [Paracoccaceae bacterium]